MRKKLIYFVFFASVVGLHCTASALVVNNFQEWNQRTQLADLEGLEITSTGHARFTARVDHDVTDVIIHPGGLLETLDTYKLPDNRHSEPERSNAYVYGTWNAYDIQSFGVERAAYIYMGPEGEINITSNTDSGASYDPLAWLDEAQLGGRSLLLAPELDPAVWSIQIEDLGGGAYRIAAIGPPPGGASMPTPEDGATDVPRDVVLSWTPGPFAPAINGHRLYLSENLNDANDGVGGITLSNNSYSPAQRLELGTTYYWRVDEVNGAPDFTVYPGDVWSFSTEPVGLPIANVTATASSSTASQGPASAVVDGSGLTDDLHSTDLQAMWSSAFGDQPAWIQFEFDRVYLLHEMLVWNSNTTLEPDIGYGFKDVTIEYSLDGVEYAALGTTHEFARAPGADGYAHNTVVDFGGAQAKYVKLTVNTNWALFPFPQFGLSEVRFLHIPTRARKPHPDPGTTDVSVGVTFSWRAGRQAAEHDVYIGTDEQAVIDGTAPVTMLTEASLSPSLDLDSTYYWRVDEVNDVETPTTWEGSIWNFSTQESLVVDGFESYNDIASGEEGSNLVYETWIDGFDNPSANGSTMGYTVPFEPTMETGTVHSGIQSAPMTYDNTTAAISEVTRTLPAQDWTAYGIQTLSLSFYGDPANTPGQLYVKINGVRINYDGPAGNLALPSWQVWNIDLASVATNLQSVTSLSVGVDGVGDKGLLLLDDIALYRAAPEPPNEWRVAAGSDDAEEHVLDAGAMAALDSSDLELGYEGDMAPAGLQTVACRWAGIPVPQGATISEAWVQFSADDVDNSRHVPDVSVIIEGQLSPSPAAFAETASDISSRIATTASVVWDIPRWTTVHSMGPEERTPDISSIIQEIVNQPGWAGEAIVLMFRDNPAKPSQGTREAESFDGDASQSPLLHISYQ